MPQPFIDVNISGQDAIAEKLKKLPAAVGDAATEAGSRYLINVLVNVEVPPYKHITYKQAYGKPPPGAFFFKLKHGMIDFPYRRRGKGAGVQSQWVMTGKGKEVLITNDDPAAKWIYSEMQANLIRLIGWLRMSQILDKYTKQLSQSFNRGVKTAIKKLGLA